VRRIKREPQLATKIGTAGRRRVMASHTWEVRLKQLAATL
jgi:spore maturation protein CgeB